MFSEINRVREAVRFSIIFGNSALIDQQGSNFIEICTSECALTILGDCRFLKFYDPEWLSKWVTKVKPGPDNSSTFASGHICPKIDA